VFSRAPAAAHRDGVVKNGSLQPATLGWSWPEKKKHLVQLLRIVGFEARSSTQHNTFPVCCG